MRIRTLEIIETYIHHRLKKRFLFVLSTIFYDWHQTITTLLNVYERHHKRTTNTMKTFFFNKNFIVYNFKSPDDNKVK